MKLDSRIKELVAIGASVTANCQPCLQYHVDKALESGADESEVTEAVEIGKMARKGAASKMDKFASSLNAVVPAGVSESKKGCGCSQSE